MNTRVLTVKQVSECIGLTRFTIAAWVREGKFPQPIQLGARRIGWRSDEVQAWIDARPRANADEVGVS
ncbi:helix-turn-helix transcriptional regulator [Caballeronia sp. LZ033]|uniref:helix-turn-helix transcriptional regulator n=1 Tax=Caballeronia sp. LZ033 TaxID=3038566 RepID=UPI0038D3FE10